MSSSFLSALCVLLSLCVLLPFCVFSLDVTISNALPRRDVNGQILDVHDGNTLLWNGTFYYYGASYGLCREPDGDDGCASVSVGSCGFNLNHNVSLFISRDYTHWTPAPQPVFQFQKDFPVEGIMFCPKMLYNRRSGLFVLWFNWIDAKAGFSQAWYGVATSPTPEGPFRLESRNVTTVTYPIVGDFAFYVDETTLNAYIIYTGAITTNHYMSIEQLSDDYLQTLGPKYNSGVLGQNVEAPSMFMRNGVYYASFGHTCCYCGQGSPVDFYSAAHPLGPYTHVKQMTAGISAQQTNILTYLDAQGQPQQLWQGDHWQSAPDRIKGHDFTIMAAILWDANDQPIPAKYVDSFNITIQGPQHIETE